MREVFGAVVVIGIVLVAVFVPVAFFPGMTGRLYQQFSLTIAFSVVLSVFNAVTLTPALAALLLDKESHSHGRFFTGVQPRRRCRAPTATSRLVRGALRLRYVMLLLFVGGLLATYDDVPHGARRRSCRRKTKATSCASCRRRPARRSNTRPRSRRRPSRSSTPTRTWPRRSR